MLERYVPSMVFWKCSGILGNAAQGPVITGIYRREEAAIYEEEELDQRFSFQNLHDQTCWERPEKYEIPGNQTVFIFLNNLCHSTYTMPNIKHPAVKLFSYFKIICAIL
jgi:hypothetical protein